MTSSLLSCPQATPAHLSLYGARAPCCVSDPSSTVAFGLGVAAPPATQDGKVYSEGIQAVHDNLPAGGSRHLPDDGDPPWSPTAAAARLRRLQASLPRSLRADPVLVASNSNDVWLLGDAVLRVCWRGDRARFVREARLVAALPPSIPHPTVFDAGSHDDLAWTLLERVAGDALSDVWLELPPAVLADLVGQFGTMLKALHAWSPPADIARLLHEHARATPRDPAAIVDTDLVPLPLPRLITLVAAAKHLAYVDAAVIAAVTERIHELASADPFTTTWRHVIHGDAVFANVLVQDGTITALLDFEWARTGPPDLELVSVIRMLEDARMLADRPLPPVLGWLRAAYPQLFAAPDLERRLWLYALAYTVRGIVFWPPDRPETELFAVHQVHRLRRLMHAGMAG